LTDEEFMQLENLIFDNWQKPAAAFTKHLEGVLKKSAVEVLIRI